ncbi:uncharacterized protein LOC123322971 [Coccinella septempunctata]|uniref:uncharacterized protein LOC123322971 n=1 Tax=Coccinella septempunctata TaxID=41139 RepID=UPI001D087088|nr:uncharacterized protein LOC123322971 [Coccinella septempunctata]
MKMKSENYHEVCELLDKLYLDTICLMEEEIQLKINMEKSMIEGENNLAKCRYIMGSNSVSAMNIPLNPEEDIHCTTSVESFPSELFPEVNKYEIISTEPKPNMTNPIKWFGYFTQKNLLKSQKSYETSLQWAIEAINIQNQLKYLCHKCKALRLLKVSLLESKE